MNKIRDFLKRHWRAAMAVVAVLLALALGYGAGRYAQPARVVTQTKVETKTVTQVQYKDRVVEKKVFVQAEKRRQHVEVVTEKKSDGTTVTKTTTDTVTDRDGRTTIDRTKDDQVASTTSSDTKREAKTTVDNRPRFRLGATVGASIPTLLGQGQLGVPGLQGLVVGAQFDVRVIGPLFLGVFGNTQGTAGLGVSGEF